MLDFEEHFEQIKKLVNFKSADMMWALGPYYSESHRHFHTLKHVLSILNIIEEIWDVDGFENEQRYKSFQCAALFHDFVYDPRSSTNEIRSNLEFEKVKWQYPEVDPALVSELILGTSSTDDTKCSKLVQWFNRMDRDIFQHDLPDLIEYGENISKEYSFVSYTDFLNGHFSLIRKIMNISFKAYGRNEENLTNYEKYMRSRILKVGVYAGSFNPFHIGHLDILNQASQLFDKIIVATGDNPDKVTDLENNSSTYSFETMIDGVPGEYEQVKFNGLLADYVTDLTDNNNYDVTIIRGFRDEKDINSELTQRKYSLAENRNLNYVFFAASPGNEHISSSAIRSLTRFNKDVSKYLPQRRRA